MAERLRRLELRAIQAWDRARLRSLARRHPGLSVHPTASSNLAVARFNLAPTARLRLGARVATERRPGWLNFVVQPGAVAEIEDDAWLRVEIAPVNIVVFAGGRLRLGPESFLNGTHVSAKQQVEIGRRAFLGPGVRVFDSDQHDRDDEHPEQAAPVRVGDHAWVASDATILRGVTIGAHSVIGARSLVTRDVPDHTIAVGTPARLRGSVGDRSGCR